jgi:hypothetical protein
MRFFELPVLGARKRVKDALIAAIDAQRSGVVVSDAPGKYRVVGFDALEAADADALLSKIEGETSPRVSAPKIASRQYRGAEAFHGLTLDERHPMRGKLEAATPSLGVLSVHRGTARLYSLSEQFALPYMNIPSGFHCQRPQTTPPTRPRDYFHYYPPNRRDRTNPQVCVVCGYPLP